MSPPPPVAATPRGIVTDAAAICPWCQAHNPTESRVCSSCGKVLSGHRRLTPGTVIASRYEIEGMLGVGGMGAVFKARDRVLDEIVAIKVVGRGSVDPDAVSTGRFRRNLETTRRFRSEIKLARKVRHRNVCAIHEYGEDGDLQYVAMELVKGRNLKQILHLTGPLIWEDACDVAVQVTDGLQAIHEAGIIHRDLKPANIMRDEQGVVRVLDFGIAKAWGEEDDIGITHTGEFVGSPEYISPERIRGRPADPRSDIYSLGVVLFEIFTGHSPFRGDTPAATILKHVEDAPPLSDPAAAQIPAALLPIIERTLAKEPSARYPSCKELRTALLLARAGLEDQPTHDSHPAPDSRDSRLDQASPSREPDGIPADALEHSSEVRLLVSVLLRALRHPEADVRTGAATALGMAGRVHATGETDAALCGLLESRHDDDVGVRAAVEQALAKLGPDGVGSPGKSMDRP